VAGLSQRLTGVEECNPGRVGEGHEHRMERLELSAMLVYRQVSA
jgi:hypothetical protein